MEDPTNLSDKDICFHEKSLNSSGSKNQEYLVMTVEIGDGRTDIITIHENDDPSFLALEFASKHNLDHSLQKSLSKLIRQNKELVEKKSSIARDMDNWSDWPGSHCQSKNFGEFDSFTPKINEKSRKIVSKYERPGNVYERLYQTSKKHNESKDITKNNENINKSKTAVNNINYGEWLYVKGIKMKEAAIKSSEEKKKKQIEQDSKELTFAPSINKVSSLISPRYYEKPEDILFRKAEMTKQKIEAMRQKYEEQKLKECSFTPQINAGIRTRETEKSIYDTLYDQADKAKEKNLIKREYDLKQYSFSPNVTLTKKRNSESHEPVYERLLNSRKRFEDNLEEVRQARNSNIDEVTGQKFFMPVTESKIEPRDKPVWEILYSKDSETKKERQSLASEEMRFWEANACAQKTTEKTKKIFDEFKEKQYEKLFSAMDSDNDGKISVNAISIDKLDLRTVELLKPVFESIQMTKEEIDFKGFLQIIENIVKSMNVDDRAYLLRREPRPQTEKTKERLSNLSPKSPNLSGKKGSAISDNLYDRLLAASKITEMRSKKNKEVNELLELKNCTFRPDLTKH
ncbi:hypothetical protein SteCoe_30763 [Stentor coeruleus]|uniref:EF-hand domain-containing protein n=1 Tax=Stentor coeruleus TaxID=5963 RepID=A0A1R2B2W6_9CILI|nr:hypothetical protein SteCoe_30763 [Stentor coeruleus]